MAITSTFWDVSLTVRLVRRQATIMRQLRQEGVELQLSSARSNIETFCGTIDVI
jgi:hypothetical protein